MRLRSRLIWIAYLVFAVAAVIVLVSNRGEAHPKLVGEQVGRQTTVLHGGGSILYRDRQQNANEAQLTAECARLEKGVQRRSRGASELSCSVPKQ